MIDSIEKFMRGMDEAPRGRMAFVVMSLGEQSYIDTFFIPFPVKTTFPLGVEAPFVEVIQNALVNERSLRDMNVVPNTYNQHKLFFSQWEAERHLESIVGKAKLSSTAHLEKIVEEQEEVIDALQVDLMKAVAVAEDWKRIANKWERNYKKAMGLVDRLEAVVESMLKVLRV